MNEAKKREVLQLLKDYRAYHSAFGGAAPLDDTYVKNNSYGPNGVILAGAEFESADRNALAESYRKLNLALRVLRWEDFEAWMSLIEPYLGDPADPSLVDHWRQSLARLDSANALIRRQNDEAYKRAKKSVKKPPEPRAEKVALVWTRKLRDRHDRAVKKLAGYLEGHDLAYLPPRLMSEEEEAESNKQNAEIYAVFQRVRVLGRSERTAVREVADRFHVSEDFVERVVEFRAGVKLASCAVEGCKGEIFSQNLCQKHYQKVWRSSKKSEKRAG